MPDDVRMTLSIIVLMSLLSISHAQNYFGCPGCCGYVAGAAGWACCRVRGVLYSTCVNNSDCLVQNSQCILGCCQCPLPFYRQNACQQCEQIPRVLGSQCLDSNECAREVFRAICTNGVCQCASAYKSVCMGNYCQCAARILGDQCTQSDDCSTNIQNAECSGSTCQCIAGFSPNVCGQCIVGQPLSSLATLGINGFSQNSGYQQNNGYSQFNHLQQQLPVLMGKRDKNN